MVNYVTIQHKIDRGIGHAAKKLGQNYAAYRCTAESTGDFPGGWTLINPLYPIFRRRVMETKLDIGQKAGWPLWFDMVFNAEPFLVGDVFIQVDAPYVPGVSYGAGATSVSFGTTELNAIAMAWHKPIDEAVGTRINTRGQIWRPAGGPMQLPDGSLYWEETNDNDQPLTLTNGLYTFEDPSLGFSTVANWIPVGMSNLSRPYQRPSIDPPTPGVTHISWWGIYIPPLPGYTPSEGDAMILEDGSRYWIVNPYAQNVDVVGSMLLAQRTLSATN